MTVLASLFSAAEVLEQGVQDIGRAGWVIFDPGAGHDGGVAAESFESDDDGLAVQLAALFVETELDYRIAPVPTREYGRRHRSAGPLQPLAEIGSDDKRRRGAPGGEETADVRAGL